MRSGIPRTGNGPVIRTSISTFFSGWFGPCHVMCFSAVFNHFLRLHVHEVAAGPPAHHYGSEMHPHMIVDSPMVGGGIGTERAKGVIGLNCGGDSIHNVGFPRRNPGHGCRTYYIVQPDVLLFPVYLVVAVYEIPIAVHEHMHGKFRGALVPTGHPLHHRKVGLDNLLSLFEAFCRFISVFGNMGEETIHCHEVPLVTALLAHVTVFLLESSQQVTSMICSIDGFQEGTGNGLSVIPNGLEILFMLEFLVFDLGHFFGLGLSLL